MKCPICKGEPTFSEETLEGCFYCGVVWDLDKQLEQKEAKEDETK